jgi:hypothetical protein
MSNFESVGRTVTTPFFVVSAVMEVGAGLGLLVAPGLAITLVFGSSGTQAGVALGRLAGAALLSLGAACWSARHDDESAASRALVTGMLIYNAALVALVVIGSFGSPGPLLWGVAVLHGVMAVWCLWVLRVGRWTHAFRSAVR